MRLVLKDSFWTFTVTRPAEPKTEYGSGQQQERIGHALWGET